MEGLIFANARAKAKELNLLSEERMLRVMDSASVCDAMRILLEVNYAGGFSADGEDYPALLKEEERLVTAFLKEAAPKDSGIECLFLRNDYHNIKSLLKARYGNVDSTESLFLPEGTIPVARLKELLEQGNWENPFMKEAVSNVEKAFESGQGTPRFIDTELDKALYKDITERLVKADKNIKKYFYVSIDTANIGSFLRTAKIGESFTFFASHFVEGGKIDLDTFRSFDMDSEKLTHKLGSGEYKQLIDKYLEGGIPAFETQRDNALLKIFSSERSDMFSVAPLVGYYLAKMSEIKNLRIIFVCIKNKVDRTEMRKRVRSLYE